MKTRTHTLQLIFAVTALAILSLVTSGAVQPSASRHTVLLIGDSMMKAMAPTLEQKFATDGWDVKSFAAIGTGLARLDLYDWIAKATTVASSEKADVAVIMMGANDNQPMRTGNGIVRQDATDWQKEYTSRVTNFVETLLKNGVKHVVWVELPAMRDNKLNADVQGINIAAREAVVRCRQVWFETRVILSRTSDGAYSAYVIQPNGMPLRIRAEDGVHLNSKGAEWLADKLVPAVRRVFDRITR